MMVVRTRREGDTFQPVGMAGKKKLKKLFIDEKVPLTLRGRIPVVCCGNEIMWIAGYRAAAKFAARETTDSVLRLAVKVLG
jgi:tRNA(Ile)-lysidine synthase